MYPLRLYSCDTRKKTKYVRRNQSVWNLPYPILGVGLVLNIKASMNLCKKNCIGEVKTLLF